MRRSPAVWAAAALALGILTGAGGAQWRARQSCSSFQYINADYACGKYNVIRKTSYAELTARVEDFLASERGADRLQTASVYFRDLRGGPVWGVEESQNFAPASLLKLPLVMTLLSLREKHPSLLETEIIYRKETVAGYEKLDQSDFDAVPLEEGKGYSMEDLFRNTVVHSDNVSYYLLVDYLNKQIPDGRAFGVRTFQELGVIDPREISEEVVTARVYAALFRLLYNVSFLDAESSEKLLTWLAASTFHKGLVAGLPEGTTVANKFGERGLPGGGQHLHDCGIVYFPANPYVLCVMTKGRNWDELAAIIARVSTMVWQEVSSRRQ